MVVTSVAVQEDQSDAAQNQRLAQAFREQGQPEQANFLEQRSVVAEARAQEQLSYLNRNVPPPSPVQSFVSRSRPDHEEKSTYVPVSVEESNGQTIVTKRGLLLSPSKNGYTQEPYVQETDVIDQQGNILTRQIFGTYQNKSGRDIPYLEKTETPQETREVNRDTGGSLQSKSVTNKATGNTTVQRVTPGVSSYQEQVHGPTGIKYSQPDSLTGGGQTTATGRASPTQPASDEATRTAAFFMRNPSLSPGVYAGGSTILDVREGYVPSGAQVIVQKGAGASTAGAEITALRSGVFEPRRLPDTFFKNNVIGTVEGDVVNLGKQVLTIRDAQGNVEQTSTLSLSDVTPKNPSREQPQFIGGYTFSSNPVDALRAAGLKQREAAQSSFAQGNTVAGIVQKSNEFELGIFEGATEELSNLKNIATNIGAGLLFTGAERGAQVAAESTSAALRVTGKGALKAIPVVNLALLGDYAVNRGYEAGKAYDEQRLGQFLGQTLVQVGTFTFGAKLGEKVIASNKVSVLESPTSEVLSVGKARLEYTGAGQEVNAPRQAAMTTITEFQEQIQGPKGFKGASETKVVRIGQDYQLTTRAFGKDLTEIRILQPQSSTERVLLVQDTSRLRGTDTTSSKFITTRTVPNPETTPFLQVTKNPLPEATPFLQARQLEGSRKQVPVFANVPNEVPSTSGITTVVPLLMNLPESEFLSVKRIPGDNKPFLKLTQRSVEETPFLQVSRTPLENGEPFLKFSTRDVGEQLPILKLNLNVQSDTRSGTTLNIRSLGDERNNIKLNVEGIERARNVKVLSEKFVIPQHEEIGLNFHPEEVKPSARETLQLQRNVVQQTVSNKQVFRIDQEIAGNRVLQGSLGVKQIAQSISGAPPGPFRLTNSKLVVSDEGSITAYRPYVVGKGTATPRLEVSDAALKNEFTKSKNLFGQEGSIIDEPFQILGPGEKQLGVTTLKGSHIQTQGVQGLVLAGVYRVQPIGKEVRFEPFDNKVESLLQGPQNGKYVEALSVPEVSLKGKTEEVKTETTKETEQLSVSSLQNLLGKNVELSLPKVEQASYEITRSPLSQEKKYSSLFGERLSQRSSLISLQDRRLESRQLPRSLQTSKQEQVTQNILKQQPLQAPVSILDHIQRPAQVQVPIQIPITVTTPVLITEPIQTTAPDKLFLKNAGLGFGNPQPLSLKIHPLGLPRKKLEEFGEGFEVFVKRKGIFERVNTVSLGRGEALALGARITDYGSAQTFKIVKSGVAAIDTSRPSINERSFASKFKSLGHDTFREKKKYAIDNPGEFKEITLKGLAAVRNGRGRL